MVGEGGDLRHAARMEAVAIGQDSSKGRVGGLTRAQESLQTSDDRARVVNVWGELRDAGSVPRP